jgi:hypothetical protein
VVGDKPTSEPRGLPALTVNVSPVSDVDDQDQETLVVDLVEDAIIADTNAPGSPPAELFDATRSRLIGQVTDGIGDPVAVFCGNPLQRTLGPLLDEEGVGQSISPSSISRMA